MITTREDQPMTSCTQVSENALVVPADRVRSQMLPVQIHAHFAE